MPRKAALTFLAFVACAHVTGCGVSKRVDVVPTLTPTLSATRDELVRHVNQWRQIESLVLRVDLQFETVEEVEEGRGRQYRTAQGRLLLERPSSIRLNIEAPILSANIAEMASNGERFQLLIHPADYRALIEGSNRASYETETARLDKDPELEKAGPLVNIRPQHFTDAFLLSPIPQEDPRTVAYVNEELVVEPDTRPGADEEDRVRKSYYVLTVVRLGEDAPRTKYWFDRVGELEIGRQQTFDPDGRLAADIRYSGYLGPDPTTGVRFPGEARIERPYDDYTLRVSVRPEGIMVNRELPESAFAVTVPPEWEESIRRIDLDERAKSATDTR